MTNALCTQWLRAQPADTERGREAANIDQLAHVEEAALPPIPSGAGK